MFRIIACCALVSSPILTLTPSISSYTLTTERDASIVASIAGRSISVRIWIMHLQQQLMNSLIPMPLYPPLLNNLLSVRK